MINNDEAMIKNLLLLLATGLFVLLAEQVHAEKKLSTGEVKALFSNVTFDSHNEFKDKSFTVFLQTITMNFVWL